MKLALIAAGLGGLMLLRGDKMLTLGIRNNNPGNIEYNPDNAWRGEVPRAEQDRAGDNQRFTAFYDARDGIRAIAKTLMTYQRQGIDTINGIVNRWAPGVENNVEAYADHLAKIAGVEPGERISITEHLPELVRGIIYHENGTAKAKVAYTSATIDQGIERAWRA